MATNRDYLLAMMPKDAVCAEIGVWIGGFSRMILNVTKPSNLFLIDPWLWDLPVKVPRDCYIANTRLVKNQADMDKLYTKVNDEFEKLPNVTVMRQKSVDAAAIFQDNYFDWIYIDGAHDYQNVKADLEAWSTKVKPGGFLTGDDWDWGKKYNNPVRRAVQDFIKLKTYKMVKTDKNQFILTRITK